MWTYLILTKAIQTTVVTAVIICFLKFPINWGILIYCVSSVVILSFSFSFFHSSFIQCYPLGSSNLVGKVLSIGI